MGINRDNHDNDVEEKSCNVLMFCTLSNCFSFCKHRLKNDSLTIKFQLDAIKWTVLCSFKLHYRRNITNMKEKSCTIHILATFLTLCTLVSVEKSIFFLTQGFNLKFV